MFNYLKKIRQNLNPKPPAQPAAAVEARWTPLQKGIGKIIVRQNPAFIDAEGKLLVDFYLYQRGTRHELTSLGKIGQPFPPNGIELTLTAPDERLREIEVVLLQGNEELTPLKDWLGVYCLYPTPSKVKDALTVKLIFRIEEVEGVRSLTLSAADQDSPKPVTLTWAYPGEYCWEILDSDYDFLKQVYGFATFLRSGAIIGYQESSHWLLPGGIIPAPVKQEQKLSTSADIFGQMRRHLEAQTGLVLTQLSDPYALTITELAGGLRHINAFFIAGAIGALTKGLFLDPAHLPEFSAYVDARNVQAALEQYLSNENLEDISKLPANVDPVSRRPAGGLEGVFITAAPTMLNQAGVPCYQLLRFYPDGLVLQAGVCDAEVEAAQAPIQKWFQRDTTVEVGRGVYYTLEQQVWFTTSTYFTQLANEITLDFAGVIQDADHLNISVRDRRSEVVTADVKYRRFVTGQPVVEETRI